MEMIDVSYCGVFIPLYIIVGLMQTMSLLLAYARRSFMCDELCFGLFWTACWLYVMITLPLRLDGHNIPFAAIIAPLYPLQLGALWIIIGFGCCFRYKTSRRPIWKLLFGLIPWGLLLAFEIM